MVSGEYILLGRLINIFFNNKKLLKNKKIIVKPFVKYKKPIGYNELLLLNYLVIIFKFKRRKMLYN